MALAALYLQLSAQFIAVMQVLIYAGAILVLFMFVIILFQDAYGEIAKVKAKSSSIFLFLAAAAFIITLVFLGRQFVGLSPAVEQLPEGYGSVQALGEELYIHFFFPFEAVILLFLVAIIGSLYMARKVL